MARRLTAALIAVAAVPAVHLAVRAIRDDLGANPVETLLHTSGDWALRFLLLSLAVTPVRRLLHWNAIIKVRRLLGLTAFAYATGHVSVYAVLDRGLEWSAVLEDLTERPYVTAGATAFACLVPLAITSTRGWIRRLGRRWQQLHRLVYVAAVAAVVHYWWLVKADTREPLVYAAVLAVLLGARLLPPRRPA